MRRLMLPVGCYFAVTLGIPLLNGAHSWAFVEHAVIVAAGTLVALGLVAVSRRARASDRKCCRRTAT